MFSRRPRHLRAVPDVNGPPVTLVADFIYAVARKLGRGGNPEDQLRGPLEVLIERVGQRFGLDPVPYGEVALKELRARPDYAVDVGKSTVGYIELKRPGRGIPPQWKPDKRERKQWEKLCSLPNVIYSDGCSWGSYCYGELREPIVRICDSVGSGLSGDGTEKLLLLVRKFLTEKPDPPRSLADLVSIVARLCRLLKDDVAAIIDSPSPHPAREDLRLLADDLRQRLFPDLSDDGFADAYAQSITFALLLAQINGVEIEGVPLHEIGLQVAKKHSIIGRLFSALTDGDATSELPTIDTLRQVIGTVDWSSLQDGDTNVYVELYENFLERYDPGRRKESGSYYTPEPVAEFMVQFVVEILRTHLNRSWGFADDGVVVLDPAMGTGTFLVEVMKSVADTVATKQGKGARSDRLRDLFHRRLIGFELQMSPYAVAELRLHEALRVRFETDIPASEMRFLTNTLDNPYKDPLVPTAPYKVIEQSYEEANRIKREERVLVAIGNPPHLGDAKRQGAWLVGEGKPRQPWLLTEILPSIDDFRTQGGGQCESDLHGMQWYFLRWALWKVFDAHPDHPTGVVALLLPESLTDGRAFAGMREYLRRTCDAGWIIDLSPEGNRPDIRTRIFGSKVSRRLCIAVFARWRPLDSDRPAVFHHMRLDGDKVHKLERLRTTSPLGQGWKECPDGWQDPLYPLNTDWQRYPALSDLMPWRSRGMTTGRPWIYAPQPQTLRMRWDELMQADVERRRALFVDKAARTIDSTPRPLPGFTPARQSIAAEQGPCPDLVMVSYRSFDRQWVIPDNRLMERARTALWAVRSSRQVFISQDIQPVRNGPGLIFCGHVPDIDHFHGNEASLVRPLYRDTAGANANISPGLLRYLSHRMGLPVSAEDFLAYLAGVVAHRGYSEKFAQYLTEPGVRIPLTAEASLWREGVQIGREILWLHTFGERCSDDSAGRPQGALALAELSGIRAHTPIVARQPGVPASITPRKIDGSDHEINLVVGEGIVGPVEKGVWEYEVNGMRVVNHWFGSRRDSPRHKKNKKGLNAVSYDNWTSELTNELLAMLTVLNRLVHLEAKQALLLNQICEAALVTDSELLKARILPVPDSATKGPSLRKLATQALPGM